MTSKNAKADKNTIWVDRKNKALQRGDLVKIFDINGNEVRDAKVLSEWMPAETEHAEDGTHRIVSFDRAEVSSDRDHVESEVIKTKFIEKLT